MPAIATTPFLPKAECHTWRERCTKVVLPSDEEQAPGANVRYEPFLLYDLDQTS